MEAADIDLDGAAPSLRDYDAERYGPLLGVSDEGSAAPAIVAAALGSPKASALHSPSALEIGVAHDGERLGSIGETPIGRDEFEAITKAVAGQILTTTNVGSHVNSWHYLRGPTVDVTANAARELSELLADHLPAADRETRIIPVYLRLPEAPAAARAGLADEIRALAAGVRSPAGVEADPSLLVEFGPGAETASVEAALELARSSDIATVAVGGVARAPSEGRTARPGLLNFFAAPDAARLLRRAVELGIKLCPQDRFDSESAANQIWAGLATAQRMGAAAAKYSLFPLTLQEMAPVLKRVQGWFSDWTAAPAFYLDLETIDGADVLGLEQAAQAVWRWLELVAEAEVPVVLIDTADKAKGRRLLRNGADDERGILTLAEIRLLDKLAHDHGIRVLWAGGIQLGQVREFGRLGCFGIYVTSAAARRQQISSAYANDPALAAEREPTREGVATTKLQLEAGFLAERVDGGAKIAALASAALDDRAREAELAGALQSPWQRLWRGAS